MDVIPKTLEVWMLYQILLGMDVIPRDLRYGCYTQGSEVWTLYQSHQKPPEVWMLYELRATRDGFKRQIMHMK